MTHFVYIITLLRMCKKKKKAMSSRHSTDILSSVKSSGSFGKVCWWQRIGFEDLVRLFSSSKRTDRFYFGFICPRSVWNAA